jgi:hypothetical protein
MTHWIETKLNIDAGEGWTISNIAMNDSPINLVTFTHPEKEKINTRIDTGKVMFIDETPDHVDQDMRVELARKVRDALMDTRRFTIVKFHTGPEES